MAAPRVQAGTPIPAGRFEYRYHNGVVWTSDVASNGQRYVDPLAPASPTHRSRFTSAIDTSNATGNGIAIAADGVRDRVGRPRLDPRGVRDRRGARRAGDHLRHRRRAPSPRDRPPQGFRDRRTSSPVRSGFQSPSSASSSRSPCSVRSIATRTHPSRRRRSNHARSSRDAPAPRASSATTGPAPADSPSTSGSAHCRRDSTIERITTVPSTAPGRTTEFAVNQFLSAEFVECEITGVYGPLPFGIELD